MVIGWFNRKKEEPVTVVMIPEPVQPEPVKPEPVLVSAPAPDPVPIVEEPKPVKPAKVSRRINLDDVAPFKLGTLQQAVQVYYHVIERGFTFADLVEYVAYATNYQAQYAAFESTKRGQREAPPMIALNREERKKFRKRR